MNGGGRVVEWSPNEGVWKKFERLAFALVRTRPSVPLDQNQRRNPWIEKCRGLGGPFALCILIAIPYISEDTIGSTLIAALLLAAIDACLAVWCYTDLESKHGHCTSDLVTCVFSSVGEFLAFLIGWFRIQGFSAGFAATCRSLSSILDSLTGRHIEVLVEDQFGTFLPLGSRIDLLSVIVAFVPTIMCALGMEESGFLRLCLFLLTSSTSIAFFSSSLSVPPLFNTTSTTVPSSLDIFTCLPTDSTNDPKYTKILAGAALASAGFFGLYKTCCPDGPSVRYESQNGNHRHYTLTKRFSLIGCLISVIAFLFYFLQASVLSKAPHNSRICRDPPLLWSLEGGWRIGIGSFGISALALTTFEFLIPLCSSVTKLANDGLLYRLLKKDANDLEEGKWTLITPLFFGFVSALMSLLFDTKILLSLVSCSLMSINILVAASMLATRYQVRITPSPHQKIHQSRHRTRSRTAQASTSATISRANQNRGKRLMTVSFLKSGLSKIPQEVKKLELDAGGGMRAGTSSRVDSSNSDRAYLINDVAIAPITPRDSIALSVGSGVSGYESESGSEEDGETYDDDCGFETQVDTDIDTAVLEYQERLRLAGTPLNPTPASARRASFATFVLVLGLIGLAASINSGPNMDVMSMLLTASSAVLSFLLLLVISRQPLKKQPTYSTPNEQEQSTRRKTTIGKILSNFFQYSIIPWGPSVAIFLHSILFVETLNFCGFIFSLWFSIGLIIYFSYGVTKSIAATSTLIPTVPVPLPVPIRRRGSSNNVHRPSTLHESIPSFEQMGRSSIQNLRNT